MEFELSDVKQAIDKLNNNKDCGPMGLDARILKGNKNKLSPIILDIFNKILKDGHVPTFWKKSYLVPIPKKGNIQDIANFGANF